MKRGADIQITRDEYNVDAEGEADSSSASGFLSSNPSGNGKLIAGRQIKQPKSQKPRATAPKSANDNPFASLFNSPAPAVPPVSNPCPIPPPPLPSQSGFASEFKPQKFQAIDAQENDEMTKELLGLNFSFSKFIYDKLYVPFHTKSLEKLSPVDLTKVFSAYARHLVSIHSKYGVQRETEKPAGKPFDPQTAIFDPAKLISGSGPLPSFAPRPAPFELATAVFDPAKPSLGETQKAEAANTPFKSDLTQAVESSYPEKKEISIDESTRSSAKKVLTFQTAPAFSVAASEMNVDETPRPAISARLDFSSKIAEETPKPNFQFSMTKIEDSGFSFSFKPPAATAAVVEKSANKNQTPSFSLGTPAEAAPPSSFGFDSVASAKKSPEISQGSPEQHLAAKQKSPEILSKTESPKQQESSVAPATGGFKPSAAALNSKKPSDGFKFFSQDSAADKTEFFAGGWKPPFSSDRTTPKKPETTSAATTAQKASSSTQAPSKPAEAKPFQEISQPKFVSFGTPSQPTATAVAETPRASEKTKELSTMALFKTAGENSAATFGSFYAPSSTTAEQKSPTGFTFGSSTSTPAFSFSTAAASVKESESLTAAEKKPSFSFSFGSAAAPSAFGSSSGAVPLVSFSAASTPPPAKPVSELATDASTTAATPKPFTFAAAPAFSFNAPASIAVEPTKPEAPKSFSFSFGSASGSGGTSTPPAFGQSSLPAFGQTTFGQPVGSVFGQSANTNPAPFQFTAVAPAAMQSSKQPHEEGNNEGDEEVATAEGFRNERTEDQQELLKRGEGEEDEQTITEVRCRIFRFDPGMRELGINCLKLNQKAGDEMTARLLARQEGSGKVVLNARVNAYVSSSITGEKKRDVCFLIPELDSDNNTKLVRYTIRCKDTAAAEQLKSTVDMIIAKHKK